MSDRSAWVLALDASTPRCVLAVGTIEANAHNLVAADDEDDGPNQASARLQGRIEALLRRAGIDAKQLGLVACGRGPGTFTGTRVAVATAKGLAYGLGVATLPVSTLAAVAASARPADPVLAILDARRSEVYGGYFRVAIDGDAPPAVEPLGDERVLGLAAVLDDAPHGPPATVIGSGVEPNRQTLQTRDLEARAQPIVGPTAAGLWHATVAAWHREPACHPAALEAVYLRASYAEMGLNAPKRPFVKSPFVD